MRMTLVAEDLKEYFLPDAIISSYPFITYFIYLRNDQIGTSEFNHFTHFYGVKKFITDKQLTQKLAPQNQKEYNTRFSRSRIL